MDIKPSMPLFWRVFLITLGVILALSVGLLVLLWNYLASYEASLPEKAIDLLIGDREMMREYIKESVGDSVSPYESPDDVADKLVSAIYGSDICYVKDYARHTDENPAYIIVRSAKRYASVVLTAGGDCGFGMRKWEVSSVELLPEVIEPARYTAEIIAPVGAEVTVGGVVLGEDEITATVEYPFLCKYEKSSEDRPMCSKYVIDGLILDINPVAEMGGVRLVCETDGDTFSFRLPDETVHSMRIIAPGNALVYLRKSRISQAPNETGRYDGSPLDSGAGDMPEYAVYEIDGLVTDIKASAEIGGIVLDSATADNAVVFTYPDELMYEVRAVLPVGAVLMINGNEVGDEYSAGVMSDPDYSGKLYSRYIGDAPEVRSFIIGGLYAEPVITAVMGGSECAVMKSEADGRVISVSFGRPIISDVPGDVSDAVTSFARAFMYYTARGHVGVDDNLKDVLSCTLAGSEAYKMISDSHIGVRFNDCYDLTVNRLDVSGCQEVTPDCMRVTLGFDTDRVLYIYTQHDEGSYDIVLVKSGGKWLVSDFAISG